MISGGLVRRLKLPKEKWTIMVESFLNTQILNTEIDIVEWVKTNREAVEVKAYMW